MDLPLWQNGPIQAAHAIRAFHGVTLLEHYLEATARLLTEDLGFEEGATSGERQRFNAPAGGPASRVDILTRPDQGFGRIAVGSVHHVAFRIAGTPEQSSWREQAIANGLRVTSMRDRTYFRSVYFQEPGGVLFEIATDAPGFAIDESVDDLGSSLQLPEWLEPQREILQKQLPPLKLPIFETATP